MFRNTALVGGIGTSSGSAQQDHDLAARMLAKANNANCLLPRPAPLPPVDDGMQSDTVRTWAAALMAVLTFGAGAALVFFVQRMRRARKRESLLE